jgi:hypothetical protein
MMLRTGYEARLRTADLILNIVDGYAQARGMGDPDPRPIEPLYFYVIARFVIGVEQEIMPPLELVMKRNRSGYHLFYGTVRMPDGAIRERVLAPGRYIVRIDTRPYVPPEAERGVPRLYQPANVTVDLPMPDPRDPASNTPYRVQLSPAPVYPFPHATPLRMAFPVAGGCNSANMPVGNGPTLLRGSLHQRDGRPRTGVTVDVPAIPALTAYTTGTDGGWVLSFPENQATGPVSLRFGLPEPDNTVVNVPDVCVVHGYECSLSQTALRGWATDRGRPVTGFTLQIASTRGGGPYQDLLVTSADGSWSYYFDLDQPGGDDVVNVTALLPDGRTLVEQNIPVRRRATIVVPAFQFQ